MKNIDIPVGISNFAEIRKNKYYYIDKTGLIEELLKTTATKVTLITRPRRFGKTLGMSMLENFFDIRKNSKLLFDGLEIADKQALCEKWMNQYPVMFLSLKSVDGNDFLTAYSQLAYEIGALYKEHDYLLESPVLGEEEKKLFWQIKERKTGKIEVMRSLQILSQLLNKHYKKEVILLIDEYDVPIAKATSNGYYKEMLEIMKGLMQALKDNLSLRFAVITGCLKIAKESIFTGTNNFVSDTITDTRLNEYFGFVQSEVDQILKDAGFTDKADLVKKWYDGYRFGDFDVYCPWDVMCYLRDLVYKPEAKPASYWRNTSDNSIIRSFIDYAGSSITNKLENLMDGGYIIQKIDENLTYDYLHSSEDNLWSMLYLTGYLTQKKGIEYQGELPEGTVALTIPNEEIRYIFETTISKWFDESAKKWNREALFDAVWSGDSESITREMSTLLRRTISYHDYREDFYHAFLSGIFTGAGYQVQSNKEHGEGRSDIVVCDSLNGRVAIFEAKRTKVLKDLETECDKALRQIDERMYAKDFEDAYDQVLCYGIAFFKKRCMVKRKES
ncbi:AAA family ATPase [Coprococcus comes]|uniref:AAA family ATPase n=1 Tax=Coprococcus comes TaxID=410072 RepID=UPI003F8C614E